MRVILLTAMLMIGGMPAAWAQANSDNVFTLLPGCRAFLLDPVPRDEYYRAGKCSGVVEGVVYTAQLVGTICPPPGSSRGQGVRLVIRHIEAARPDRHYERLAKLAHEALTAAWPCRR